MADYLASFTSIEPDCTINLVLKAQGCINSYISSNIQVNGLKIEGK